ncbi:MAG: chlorite dismutase family protein [Minicystis sp.]
MSQPTSSEGKPTGLPPIDVNEYGGKKDGERQVLNRRMFMQLLVFDLPRDADGAAKDLAVQLRERRVPAVVYADTMVPHGLGLLTWSEDPSHFVRNVRPLFSLAPLDQAILRPSFGMLGRAYASGHEPDLEFTLLRRPIENVLNEAYPWHIWYPLRRTGGFARLDPQEQSGILREHAQIGFAYGQAELAHDVRLACHGLDAEDNEFVIGIVGKDLHPLSHLVQTMRKTKQTSEFIAKMGPFFVGLALHRTG